MEATNIIVILSMMLAASIVICICLFFDASKTRESLNKETAHKMMLMDSLDEIRATEPKAIIRRVGKQGRDTLCVFLVYEKSISLCKCFDTEDADKAEFLSEIERVTGRIVYVATPHLKIELYRI